MTGITKAVIPAAGLGIRFLPVTKAMPKEMLPLFDRPVIQYVVEEAVASGITDILIITGRNKRAIEDYFDASPELEMRLEKEGKMKELIRVQEISDLADIHYIRQKEPRGLGDAILSAEKHIHHEPFAVLLGDDIVVHDIPCIRQLMDIFNTTQSSLVAIEAVPPEKVSSYGIMKGRPIDDSLYIMEDIIEKPAQEFAPSRMGAIGRYIFTPEIFDCIKNVPKGYGDEIQLTDAIRLLNQTQKIHGYCFKGKRYDTGDKWGYFEAIVDAMLRDPEMHEKTLQWFSEIVAQNGKIRVIGGNQTE